MQEIRHNPLRDLHVRLHLTRLNQHRDPCLISWSPPARPILHRANLCPPRGRPQRSRLPPARPANHLRGTNRSSAIRPPPPPRVYSRRAPPSTASAPGRPGGSGARSDPDSVGLRGSSMLSPLSSPTTSATDDATDDPATPAGSPSSGSIDSMALEAAASPGSSAATPTLPTPPHTRLQDGTIQPVNYKTKYGLVRPAVSAGEPRSVPEALADRKWANAMHEKN